MRLDELLDRKNLPKAVAAINVRGIASDSRKVLPGYLFVALRGIQQDGEQFIPDATQRGAVAILRTGINEELEHGGKDSPAILTLTDDMRGLLPQIARRFFRYIPPHIVAITGTNGKTSVAEFVRQIWAYSGRAAASLGTLGVRGTQHDHLFQLEHTTPEPVLLHHILRDLYALGIEYLALEASSHALVQQRLDSLDFDAAAFTNLSRDHMDYHKNIEGYREAKLRLFKTLLPQRSAAVINIADETGKSLSAQLRRSKRSIISVGGKTSGLSLMGCAATPAGWDLKLGWQGRSHKVQLPLQGKFQVENALVAIGLCLATGLSLPAILKAVPHLHAPEGRLELVGRTQTGAEVFVDFAHTPAALERVLDTLVQNGKDNIILVFGCGGNRDQGKRSEMGRIAGERAKSIVLTDDNPRTETPEHIRQQILAGIARGTPVHDIGERRAAIRAALEMAETGQTVLIAGKGHETGQTIGTRTLPFSDREEARAVLDTSRSGLFARARKKPK